MVFPASWLVGLGRREAVGEGYREGGDDAGRYWEIGTTGHGPRAAALARDMADAVREWDRGYGNQAPAPGFRLIPAEHRDLLTAPDPRFVIDKPASRLVIGWRR